MVKLKVSCFFSSFFYCESVSFVKSSVKRIGFRFLDFRGFSGQSRTHRIHGSGQISSRPHTSFHPKKVAEVSGKWDPLFQGNLGW